MKKIIILRGKTTAGKSTTYKNLQDKKQTENWLFLDNAAIKKGLGRDLGKMILFSSLKEIIKTKKNIIIEEVSREGVEKNVGRFLKKYGYKIIVFQFEISLNEAYKRDVKRGKEKTHPRMGRKWIKETHTSHENKIDKDPILVDCNKLNEKQVVTFILNKLK